MTDNFNCIALIILLLCSFIAHASSYENALNARAHHNYLQSNQYLKQLKNQSAQTQFLIGSNFNRLNQPQEALSHLNKAKSLGYNKANLYLERGLSYFKMKRYHDAIREFKHYDRLAPKQAKTYELIGRAYALIGNSNEAEYYFDQAAVDPSIKPRVMKFKKSLILKRLMQPETSYDKPWAFNASLGGGYNSNVVALGNNFAFPTGISRQGSQFLEVLLDGYNRIKQDDSSYLQVLYLFSGDFYENISSLNLANPFIALEYQKSFNERSRLIVDLSEDESWVGDNRFSSFTGVKPTLSYQLDRWNTIEAVYGYSYNNFFVATTAPLNRDGFTNVLSISDFVTVPNSDLTFRFGYASSWDNTKGSDFSLRADNVYFGFYNPLPHKLALEGIYSYGSYRYDNLNSLAGIGGFKYKRRDNTNRYVLQLLRGVNRTTTLYCRYENFDDNANIPVYSYKQYVFSMGLTANWS